MKKLLIILAAALLLFSFSPSARALTDQGAMQDRHPQLAVKNAQGDYVGTISNALADPMGNITFVILSLGGGGETKNIVVPVSAFSQDGGELVLNMDESQLAAAPEFHMSDLNDPSFGERVYRYYGQVPPWSEGSPDETE